MADIRDLAPASFLAPAGLIAGEDRAHYETLLARITGAFQPSDVIEEIWVRDVVDLVWDALRLRRLKASVLDSCLEEGMDKVLRGWGLPEPARSSRAWAEDPVAVEKVEAALAAAGSSLDMVAAQTFSQRFDVFDDLDRIERMTMAVEARRNAALEEIGCHRATFAKRLRRANGKAGAVARKAAAAGNAPAGAPI